MFLGRIMVLGLCFLKNKIHLEIHTKIFTDNMTGFCNLLQNKLERIEKGYRWKIGHEVVTAEAGR